MLHNQAFLETEQNICIQYLSVMTFKILFRTVAAALKEKSAKSRRVQVIQEETNQIKKTPHLNLLLSNLLLGKLDLRKKYQNQEKEKNIPHTCWTA